MTNEKQQSYARSCKNMYIHCKKLLKTLGLSEEQLENMLANNSYEIADIAMRQHITEVLQADDRRTAALVSIYKEYGLAGPNLIFDMAWDYRRNLHLCVEHIPDVSVQDFCNTTLLDNISSDICLDIKHNKTIYGVYLFKRNITIQAGKTELKYTAVIFGKTYLNTPLSPQNGITSGINSGFGNETSQLYTIHFANTEDLRKVYIELPPNDCTNTYKTCMNYCKNCMITELNYCGDKANMLVYPLRIKENNGNCMMQSKIYSISPHDVIKSLIYALSMFNRRDNVVRKNGVMQRQYNNCRVHAATPDIQHKDKVVMLPLHEYVADYKASHPYEYKGGHHASPTAHTRRGYYRRSKHGDYIRNADNTFTKVEKGKGNFTFVKPTVVNSKTDRVTVYHTPKN